jgi:hypothetical protein
MIGAGAGILIRKEARLNSFQLSQPIRKQIGMNSGTDAMIPFSEANSVIGRSFTLADKIVGICTDPFGSAQIPG